MIFSQDLKSCFRKEKQDFSRKPILSFSNLILYFLNFCKNSYQDELDHFFTQIEDSKFLLRKVTKGALSQARSKLDPQVFLYLIKKSQDFIENHLSLDTWCGFRLLAVDGSTLYLHQNPENQKHFSCQSNQHKDVTMARVSQCFDVLNGFTQDIQLSAYSTGERDLLSYHCMNLPQNSLLLLDRGYPSYQVFYQFLEQEQDFVARVPISFNTTISAFLESTEQDSLVSFPRPKALKNLPPHITVRLIKVKLEKSTEILVTSLLDSKLYPQEIFKDLYQQRWPVEEDYKKVKSSIQVENFSGKSVHSVYQDVYAKVLSKNITIALMNPLKPEVEELTKTRKYSYKMNLNHALSKMKHNIIHLLTGQHIEDCLDALSKLWTHTLEPIRKGRTYPRIIKNEYRYPIGYKPLC